jgi:hypothetical protein
MFKLPFPAEHRVDLFPERAQQAGGIAVVIRFDRAQPVLVVFGFRRPAPPTFYLVGVVKADQATAVWPMEGQRVVKPVGLVCGCRHLVHLELHPISELVDDEDLAVEIQQRVERRIPACHHNHYHTLITD